jgi:di/tricarboxylate transporter
MNLIPIIFFTILGVFFTHLLGYRFFSEYAQKSPQVFLFKLSLIWFLILLVFLGKALQDSNFGTVLSAFFYCMIVYLCLVYTYFHFFNMSETARRIRILIHLLRQNLSSEQLNKLYGPKQMIQVRLSRLCEMGWLKLTPDGLVINNKLALKVAQLFNLLHSLFSRSTDQRAKNSNHKL